MPHTPIPESEATKEESSLRCRVKPGIRSIHSAMSASQKQPAQVLSIGENRVNALIEQDYIGEIEVLFLN